MKLHYLLLLGAALLFASASNASPIASITLSDLTSESDGGPCEPNCNNVPVASQLDATLTFTVSDNVGDLDVVLTLSNDTTIAEPWKISDVYFNLTSAVAGLASVNLMGWTMSTDACPVGSSTNAVFPCNDMGAGAGSASTKADGFGIFDVHLRAPGGGALVNNTSINFSFTVAGANGTMAEAFTNALSRDSEAGGLFLSIAAAKFIEGPNVACPLNANVICDSGFGASLPVPEPSTAALIGLALLGGAGLARRFF